MKVSSLLSVLAVTAGFSAAVAQDIKLNIPGQATAPAPTPAAATFTDAQLVEEFGWFIGKRVGLTELNFTPAEMEALLKGFSASAGGKESPFDLPKIGPQMDEFMQKKQAVDLERLKKQGAAASQAYFAKLKENKAIVELPDGLRYEITQPGSGAYPKPTDTVKVHYTGTLIDGTVFDSSIQRGEPAEFALTQVIPGWTEGIQKINKGGKIKLYVPPQLAYGDDGRPGIPPSSTLVFDVELLDIKATPATPAAAAPAAAAPAPATK